MAQEDWTTIKEGDRGPHVKFLQYALCILDFLPVNEIDGVYGPATAQAVHNLEVKAQITVDKGPGVAAGEVWNAIYSRMASIQKALVENGIPMSVTNGTDGPATFQAVKEFQFANGLKADGIVGPTTESYLNLVLW